MEAVNRQGYPLPFVPLSVHVFQLEGREACGNVDARLPLGEGQEVAVVDGGCTVALEQRSTGDAKAARTLTEQLKATSGTCTVSNRRLIARPLAIG